jgi:hypothetical protein
VGTGAAQVVGAKPRLSTRDRWIVAAITILALAAAVSAAFSVLEATLTFFGVQPTPRESAVGGQSSWVFLWALATPFCSWAVLRGGRKAIMGVAVWLVLLVLSRWWWWPGPPSDDPEALIQPLWQNRWGVLPWALVAASLVVGLIAAWRNQVRQTRLVAIGAVAGILAIAGVSYANLLRHAQDEEPTPLAEGAVELEALRTDPLWNALPAESITRTDEQPAVLSDWGEKYTTWRSVTLGTTQNMALFERGVAAAELSGWTLHDSFCTDGSAHGTFSKTFPQGPAYLSISLASYLHGVDVFMNLTPAPGPASPDRCWDQ